MAPALATLQVAAPLPHPVPPEPSRSTTAPPLPRVALRRQVPPPSGSVRPCHGCASLLPKPRRQVPPAPSGLAGPLPLFQVRRPQVPLPATAPSPCGPHPPRSHGAAAPVVSLPLFCARDSSPPPRIAALLPSPPSACYLHRTSSAYKAAAALAATTSGLQPRRPTRPSSVATCWPCRSSCHSQDAATREAQGRLCGFRQVCPPPNESEIHRCLSLVEADKYHWLRQVRLCGFTKYSTGMTDAERLHTEKTSSSSNRVCLPSQERDRKVRRPKYHDTDDMNIYGMCMTTRRCAKYPDGRSPRIHQARLHIENNYRIRRTV
ncbi:hypothetical protein VPH35_065402 [Triticum aestivum]